ncbi:MAG: pro-sigmaK processing inhibitor BofA family protein [Candidatus Norongarragalinales archaeon]
MAAEAVFALPNWVFLTGGILLVLLAIAVVFFLKNFLANSLLGVAALLVINFLGASSGISIPLNLLTVVICGVLGLAGAGLILLLFFFGIKIY